MAQALVIQALKTVQQVSLDFGDWTTASLLWPFQDPLASEEFAGEESEMREVYMYKKGLAELKAKSRTSRGLDEQGNQTSTGNQQNPEGEGRGRGNGRPKGRGRGNQQQQPHHDGENGEGHA